MRAAAKAGPLAAAGALLLLAGCATTPATTPGDPWERVNRGTQKFNDSLDRAILKPVATRYRDHVPQVIRTGIGNLLAHLAYTTTIVNDLLQLKLRDTAADIGRFAINTTLGLGGLMDPATPIGLPRNEEDFGQTLGRWGVPSGPYLVLPFLGPSTLRDAPALYADSQTDVRELVDLDTGVRIALVAVWAVDRRAALLAADPTLDAAFDRYAFIRNAWLQRREYLVRDGDVPDEAPPEEEFDDPADYDVAPSSSPATSLMPASAPSIGGALR